MIRLVVNIDVDDLDAGARFYTRALGLRAGRRLFEGTVLELHGGGVPIFLLSKAAGSSPFTGAKAIDTRRAYQPHWTPVHLDLEVDDLDASVDRAVEAGAHLEERVEGWEWGRLALLRDPFGHGFCLLELNEVGRREMDVGGSREVPVS